MKKQVRFFNMYVSIFFSVTIVLFFIGLICITTLSARNLIANIKSQTSFTIILSCEIDSLAIARLENLLNYAPYCSRYQFISKEKTIQDYKSSFNEDPQEILGYNPFNDSYEIFLQPKYVSKDSVFVISQELKSLPFVDDVIVNEEVLSLFGEPFNKIVWVLIAITLVLFLISEVLIINTIRLQIYSKRFIISTMKLVGATAWKIKQPFIRNNFMIGIGASFLTLFILALFGFYINKYLNILLFPPTIFNVGILVFMIFFASIFITTLTSFFACDRYLRVNSSTIYEI